MRMSKQNSKLPIIRFDTYFFCLSVTVTDIIVMLFGGLEFF